MKTFTSSVAIAALLDQTNAWWGNGHLLTAQVAYEILQEESPDTIDGVEEILDVLKKSDPSWTNLEDKHPFVECSTFADEIKHKGGAYQAGWHFVDTPFLDEGGDINDYDFTFDTHNVTEAIMTISDWVNKADGYKDSFEYQQIQQNGLKGHSEADGLSTAMRLLLHYVGDIHQPLHATSRVNHEFTQGDRGGNSVVLPSVKGAKNLHSVWDSLAYSQADGDFDLPFNDTIWDKISTTAKDWMKKYPVEESVAKDMNVTQWATDTFHISETFVYEGVEVNKSLSDEYIAKAQEICEEQIVIGGNRLATLLKSLDLEQWKEEVAAQKANQETYISRAGNYLYSALRIHNFKFNYNKDQVVLEFPNHTN